MSVLKPITDSQYRFLLRFYDTTANAVITLDHKTNPAVASAAVRRGLGVRLTVRSEDGRKHAAYRLSRNGKRVLGRLEEGRQVVLQPRSTPRARHGHVVRD